MSSDDDFFFGFFRSPQWLRHSKGTGIGTVAGSPVMLRVNLSVGSGYALDAKSKHVQAILENLFSDFDLVREPPPRIFGFPGTTLEFIITGLSAGAGIVVAEFLKELGKDLWKALKPLLRGKKHEERNEFFGDGVIVTLVIDGKEVSAHIRLPPKISEATTSEQLKDFLEITPVNLYLEEIKTSKQDVEKSKRSKPAKAKKEK